MGCCGSGCEGCEEQGTAGSGRVLCVIPARFASTRLPQKMLADIGGKPLVMWAYDNAVAARCFDEVVVATDDERIADAVKAHGGLAIMTSPDHPSGTDRVYEAARKMNADIVVNLQGDEPEVPAKLLWEFVESLRVVGDKGMLTVVADAQPEDMANPNAVKVVLGREGQALYFSRASIPFDRDDQGAVAAYRHIGIYGFSAATLLRFVNMPQGVLERIEKLEQLRALENGMRITCMHAEYDGCGIDTPADLETFRNVIAARTSALPASGENPCPS